MGRALEWERQGVPTGQDSVGDGWSTSRWAGPRDDDGLAASGTVTPMIRIAITRLRRHPNFDVVEYPGASHGFAMPMGQSDRNARTTSPRLRREGGAGRAKTGRRFHGCAHAAQVRSS